MSTASLGAITKAPTLTPFQKHVHDILVAVSILLPMAAVAAAFVLFWHIYPKYPVLVFGGLAVFAVSNWILFNGISIGFHRMGTHSAVELVYPLDYIFIAAGCMTLQGPPLKWIIDHLIHHDEADDDKDPHSPHDKRFPALWRRFLHAHILWFLYWFNPEHRPPEDAKEREQRSAMLHSDPTKRAVVYFSHRKPYLVVLAISVAFPTLVMGLLALAAYGPGMWWEGCLTGFIVAWVSKFWVNHGTYCVNSVCHLWGYRNLKNWLDKSVNNIIVAIITHGEGHHGNHHDDPWAPNHGWTFLERLTDHSYHVLWVLKRLGWAKNCTFRTEKDFDRIQEMQRIFAIRSGLNLDEAA